MALDMSNEKIGYFAHLPLVDQKTSFPDCFPQSVSHMLRHPQYVFVAKSLPVKQYFKTCDATSPRRFKSRVENIL